MQDLRELQPNLAPTTLMCDFETAAIRAFEQEFPGLVMTGCFFHLGQCCWRKCQQLRLVTFYAEEDDLFASWLRCLPALAFVPTDQVVGAFESLTDAWQRRAVKHFLTISKTPGSGGHQDGKELNAVPPCFPSNCGTSTNAPCQTRHEQTTA